MQTSSFRRIAPRQHPCWYIPDANWLPGKDSTTISGTSESFVLTISFFLLSFVTVLPKQCFPTFRYVNRDRVEEPDIVIGIHPGLHAEGVYEFWEPTLDLLLDKGIRTAFTVLSKEEYVQTIERLDGHFVKYLYKGPNPFGSKHVKQTPHEPNLMWSSNQFYIVFQVSFISTTTTATRIVVWLLTVVVRPNLYLVLLLVVQSGTIQAFFFIGSNRWPEDSDPDWGTRRARRGGPRQCRRRVRETSPRKWSRITQTAKTTTTTEKKHFLYSLNQSLQAFVNK